MQIYYYIGLDPDPNPNPNSNPKPYFGIEIKKIILELKKKFFVLLLIYIPYVSN